MHDTERAWAAGFFDGEGHIRCQIHPKGRQLRVEIRQCNRENLERFWVAVGYVGGIDGPYKPRPKGKNIFWSFRASSYADVKTAIDVILPFLGSVKRDQAEAAFAKWDSWRSAKKS